MQNTDTTTTPQPAEGRGTTPPTIATLKWGPHPAGMGERATADFPNGYGVSVLRGEGWYTTGGTFEVAVLKGGHLCYDTDLTDDVLGYLSEDEANKAIADVAALEAVPA